MLQSDQSGHASLLKEVEGLKPSPWLHLNPFCPLSLGGLSLVSELIRPKRMACKEDERDTKEFEKVECCIDYNP